MTKLPDSVPPAESFDNETFYRHYNARHAQIDLDIAELRPLQRDLAVDSLRAFHERCHIDNEFAYDHEHE